MIDMIPRLFRSENTGEILTCHVSFIREFM